MSAKSNSKKEIIGYTDCNLVGMGDRSGKIAPIRAIKVISYDRDKYCVIEFYDFKKNKWRRDEIKSGYIYKKPGRIGKVPNFSHKTLCSLPETNYDDKDYLKPGNQPK